MPSALLGIQTLKSLLNDKEPAIDWIIDGMIPRSGVTFLVARPGAGKSLLSHYLAACVLTGNPLFGAIAVQTGAVLYVDLDMHRKRIATMRAAAALRGQGLTDTQIIPMPLYIAAQESSIDLRVRDVLDKVLAEVGAIDGLALVILDTHSDLHHGKEGSPDDMTDTATGTVEIATKCNCGVLVIHHQRKNGGDELEDVRGASSITAKADAVFLLKTERDDGGNPGALTLLQRKARLTEEARPRKIKLEATGDVDGILKSYTYDLVDAASPATTGRPPTTSNEAKKITTRLLWETPDMPRPELVKKLMEAGIPQATAYRVAGVVYQKPPNLGVGTVLINGQTVARTEEIGFSPARGGGVREETYENDGTNDEGLHGNGALPQPIPAGRVVTPEDDELEERDF